MTALIISNDEMKDIMKIVKALEEPGLLLKGVSEAIENETKEQKRKFLGILLGSFAGNLLGNMLKPKLLGQGVIRAGEGKNRAGHDF